MATGGLYGNASESVGLYGNTTNFGGSYFEWFIFYQSDTQPATPTGGSWSFTTNTGTAPTGWSTVPFSAPTLPVWVSIALVNSRSDAALAWSAPGLFSYSSGLPILSGSGAPSAGDGINSQLYIQTSTTPQTIWFKQSGTWNRLVGSTLYADLTSAQTVAGIKTFSSPIVGSVTGTSENVTGVVAIANGGTSSTTASGARSALGVTATGQDTTYAYRANNLSDLASASTARTNLGLGTIAIQNANSVAITGGTISGLSSPLPVLSGGTGVTASSGANSVVLRDANGNVVVNVLSEGFVNVAAAGTTTVLTASSAPSYCVTGSGGQTYQLPDATTLTAGTNYFFNNNQSSGTIVVKNNSSTTIATIQSGGYVEVLLLVATPAAGTWDVHNYAPSNVSWSTNTFDYPGSITSATWNGATVAINRGGTGQATANAAFNALAPSQTGNSGKYLTTDGTNSSWATNPLGTVTSVGGTGTVNGITLTGTVTTSGNLTLGGTLSGVSLTSQVSGTLPTANGGTGLTSFTSGGVVYASSTSALATGSALTFDGTNLSVGAQGEVRAYNTANTRYGRFVTTSVGTVLESFNGAGEPLILSAPQPTAYIGFNVNSTEGMRLTSTSLYTASGINVGFGTSSVSGARLSVVKTGDNSRIAIGDTAANTYSTLLMYGGSGKYNFQLGVQNNVNNAFEITPSTAVNGTTFSTPAFVIDSSSNVGIGASSPVTKVDIQSTSGVAYKAKRTSSGVAGGIGAGAESQGLAIFATDFYANTPIIFGVNQTDSSSNPFLGLTERMRINATAPILCLAGGSTTATGTGIAFPATQSASSDANTLDDYEEGTWTYAFTSTTGTITKNSTYPLGLYTKIGRQVTVTGFLIVSSVSSPTGVLTVTGLPFVVTSTGDRANYAGGGIYGSELAVGSVSPLMVTAEKGATSLTISKFVTGSSANLAGDVVADTRFYVSLSYFTD